MRIEEIKNEIDEIKKWKDKIKREDLKYEAGKYKYDFQQYETKRSFGESIYSEKVSILAPDMDQTNLLENMNIFHDKFGLKTKESKDKKRSTFR